MRLKYLLGAFEVRLMVLDVSGRILAAPFINSVKSKEVCTPEGTNRRQGSLFRSILFGMVQMYAWLAF